MPQKAVSPIHVNTVRPRVVCPRHSPSTKCRIRQYGVRASARPASCAKLRLTGSQPECVRHAPLHAHKRIHCLATPVLHLTLP